MELTPNLTSTWRRGPLTLVLALLAFAVGTVAALKLPAGPMPGGGLGPGMEAMHDGDIGPILRRVLERAKSGLHLDPRQETLWGAAAAQSKAVREAARSSRQQVRDTLVTELAKAEPDLKVVAGAADPVHQEYQAERRKARDLWLDLYAGFSPEQKAVVRDLLRDQFTRTEAYHDRVREQRQQRRVASGVGPR